MGGMAAPMQQMQAMGMPQQPMGMPQQAQGIMASSQPLVDAIAADAANPAGGDTLSMAQGGLASEELMARGYRHGGLHSPNNFAGAFGLRDRRRGANIRDQGLEREQLAAARVIDTVGGIPRPYRLPDGSYSQADIEAAGGTLPPMSPSRRAAIVAQEFEASERKRLMNQAGTLAIPEKIQAGIREYFTDESQDTYIKDAMAKEMARKADLAEYGSGDDTQAVTEDDLKALEAARIQEAQAEFNRTVADETTALTAEELAQAEFNRTVADETTALTSEEEAALSAAKSERYAPLPPTRPGAGPAEAAGTSPSDGGPQGPDEVIGGYNTAANQVASILNTDKKAGSKDIAAFKKEFMEAMPKYEGMSEEEKGFLIAEAGLRVMAGKSGHAIENIAKGLQGLGPALMKGAKEKRAWNRQVELSAAKYGLENVAREAAEDRADERKVFFFYDQTKKTKDNPYGPMVTVSMADIVANGGKIPEGLVEKDLVSKSIASANASTARLQKLITDNAKIYRISASEAKSLKEELGVARTSFVSGQIGIDLLATVKGQVAGDKITGLGNAGKELYRRAFKAVNIDVGKKYKDISSARADIRRAFQSLIPLSLGSTQSANSISNRDVQFLADAYINSGFLKDGVLSFATVDSTALGKQLDGAIGKFKESQKQGLATYNRVLERIGSAEEGLSGARALGVPVSPGPFGRKYFQSTIEDIRPYAESTRTRLEGGRVKPMFAPKSFGALKDFDFINGKYVPKGSQ